MENKKQDEEEGRSSSSDDCANALHDRDAQRRLRACDGAAHGGVHAHVNLVAVVGPCSVCARRRRDDAKEVRLPIIRRRSRGAVDVSGHS
eukprot:3974691-Pleurochrysis_carterae.AAC.2